jgi:hypothetical protein
MNTELKPSLWWLALAPIILAFGVGGGTTLLLKQARTKSADITFASPISRTISIKHTGMYVLSHDYKITFGGLHYDVPPELPDEAYITLKNANSEVELKNSWGSGMVTEKHARSEVGRFSIDEAGDYTLSISGLPDKRIMTFSRSVLVSTAPYTILGILLNFFGWFCAPAIVITVFARRIQNRRILRASHPE